jgi:hypothetical protein
VETACCQQAAIRSRLTIILQTRGLRKSPSGQARCSRQHRRRGGEIRRKGADLCGCHAAVPARFRIPPPDSGVVPFSEKPSSPIKSDSNSSGRIEISSGGVMSHLHRPRYSLGRKSTILATVPAGLADSRGPTWAGLPGQQMGSGLRQGSRGRLRYGDRSDKAPATLERRHHVAAQAGFRLSVAPCRMTDSVQPPTETTG